MIRKLIKYGAKTIAWILGLTIIIWVVVWIYVEANEQQLIDRLSQTIERRTSAEVKIGGLSVSFIRTFPLLSLQLTDVAITDSLYAAKNRRLLSAKDVYLRVSIPGLIVNDSPVGKVIIRNGEINIITDSAGNTNEYVFKSVKTGRKQGSVFPTIILRNVVANYENAVRKKHHKAMIRVLKCDFDDRNGKMTVDINTNMLVRNLGFNTAKGSYLRNKTLSGKFKLEYHKATRQLMFNDTRLRIDGHPFTASGKFTIDRLTPDLSIQIATKNVGFNTAVALLSERLQGKVKGYAVAKPIDLTIAISGKALYMFSPLVRMEMIVKGNKVTTPQGTFDKCSFTASFTNEIVTGKKRTNENSAIILKDFSASWQNIAITSRTIKITNLAKPYLECDLKSNVDMVSLNQIAKSSTLEFLKGKAAIDVTFKGPVNGNDSAGSNINGSVTLLKAAVKYLPRNITLTDFSGKLNFVNNDFLVKDMTARVGKTALVMNAAAKNFLSLLNVSPEKLVLTWNIHSPHLYLQDFKGFLSKPQTAKRSGKNEQLSGAVSKVDKMFSEGDFHIALEAPIMEYKTFRATDVKAMVMLKPTEITLEKIALHHAGGSMEISGSVRNGVQYNPVTLRTHMTDMDIPKLFAAFGNFGQDAITHENLSGKLTADIVFNSAITNNADLVSDVSEGTIDFTLKDGELNNFPPLQEISKKAFKKQDFSRIKFADLENRLDVRGTAFIVNPMDIRSTALNFSVEGVYDFKKGTDMSIKLPVRNLTSSQADTDIRDGASARKGMSLRLRAKTGDDGKLKLSWDPFRKSIKNKQDVKDSNQVKK